MDWIDGEIDGCRIHSLTFYNDERGWLAELFRVDELAPDVHPQMAYVSSTQPDTTRGPHEHVDQTDVFAFFSGAFRVYLWDDRTESRTYGHRRVIDVGEANPVTVIVPPGVVHAYRNIGDSSALVFNCPNRLYAGEGKTEQVDEIRHEDRADSPFVIE